MNFNYALCVGQMACCLYHISLKLFGISPYIIVLVQGRVDMGSVSISTVPWSVSLLEGVWEVLVAIGTHPRFGGNLGGRA